MSKSAFGTLGTPSPSSAFPGKGDRMPAEGKTTNITTEIS
jgi:hypothetical protein